MNNKNIICREGEKGKKLGPGNSVLSNGFKPSFLATKI